MWCLVTASYNDAVATTVLHKIVDLYVTIRGFAFATSCIEMYKQEHKKTLQKRWALRSELCTNDYDYFEQKMGGIHKTHYIIVCSPLSSCSVGVAALEEGCYQIRVLCCCHGNCHEHLCRCC